MESILQSWNYTALSFKLYWPTHVFGWVTIILHCPSSILHCPSSVLHCPSSILNCPSSILNCPSSILNCPTSILNCPTSILHCLRSKIIICYSVIRRCILMSTRNLSGEIYSAVCMYLCAIQLHIPQLNTFENITLDCSDAELKHFIPFLLSLGLRSELNRVECYLESFPRAMDPPPDKWAANTIQPLVPTNIWCEFCDRVRVVCTNCTSDKWRTQTPVTMTTTLDKIT